MLKHLLKLSMGICLFAYTAFAVDPGTLYRNTIPEDKQLDPAWVASLTERGHPLDRRISGSKKEGTLKYIGMPVGGIGCGTVYLSDDGRLYVWDIWNQGHAGVLPTSVEFSRPVSISAGQVSAVEILDDKRIGFALPVANALLPVTNALVLDLNADTGLSVEDESMVTSWTNQAPNPKALNFKITEEGRTKTIISQKELGTGRPTLKKNAAEINGHNSLVFREDELINDNDEAFHGMMTGGGYTWFAVIKPYEQGGPGKINSRYPNAFFGCLRNTAKPQLEEGQYAGFWGSFYPDGRVYMGSRNGISKKVRDGVNTPEVEAPPPSTNEWHIIMGRQGSGTGIVQLELFVNDPSEAVNSHDYPVAHVEPSRMAIGTERNAINHMGKESFDGELARLLMFETALDEQQMKAIYDYLRTVYFE